MGGCSVVGSTAEGGMFEVSSFRGWRASGLGIWHEQPKRIHSDSGIAV